VVTAGALGAAVLAAACSSGSSTTGAAGNGTTPAGGSGASNSASGSGGTVIATATAAGSTFLTDGGRAVYVWTKDGSGMSACSGACTGTWPPVTATGMVTAAGTAKASDIGTITRSDGTKQVTYNGHPLYFFSGDSGPGTASGQGSSSFGAKWWLVAPAGSDVTASVSSFTSSAPSTPASKPAPSAPASSHSAGGGWA
jgi:predicted lipoprotein with Yx(FWY)xxD motif